MKFVIYKDSAGLFRWRLVAPNGKIIADSAESYWNKSDCHAGIALVKSTNVMTPVVDLTLAVPVRK
jgi:uncharacterized protein YegP (UPF0339 family)